MALPILQITKQGLGSSLLLTIGEDKKETAHFSP